MITKKQLRFSVVIPARNEADFILPTIASVKKQDTTAGFEIIVVDNGSVDGTTDIAKQAGGVQVIWEPLAGLPQARETGRKAAKGEYIVYIDADTTMPVDYLSRVNDAIVKHPGAVGLSNPFTYYDGTKLGNFLVNLYFTVVYPAQSLILIMFGGSKQVLGGSFTLKASTLEEIGGFNVSLDFFGEDTDISKRIGKKGKILFLTNLKVATSARRFKLDGGMKTTIMYIKNYFSVVIFNRASNNTFPRSFLKAIFVVSAIILGDRLISSFSRGVALSDRLHTAESIIQNSEQQELILTIVVLLIVALALYNLISPKGHLYGSVVTRMNTSEKLIALTFDDGPTPEATNQVLKILKKYQVPATFFVIGERATAQPEIIKQIAADGHDVGLHANRHAWALPFQTRNIIAQDLSAVASSIKGLVPKAQRPLLYRPPHGWKTPWMLQTIRQEGYTPVLWNIITTDFYEKRTAEFISQNIVKRIKPGSIIVLHDGVAENPTATRQNMLSALPVIIEELEQKGYTFVRLKDLI